MRTRILLAIIWIYTFSNPASADSKLGQVIIDTFETFGSDTRHIPPKTRGYSVDGWYGYTVSEATAIGVGACAVPFMGYGAMLAEFPYLMRELYNSSLGQGHLIYGKISKSDFEVILALWADDKIVNASDFEQAYAATLAIALKASEVERRNTNKIYERAKSFLDQRGDAKKYLRRFARSFDRAVARQVYRQVYKAVHKVTMATLSQKLGVKVGGKVSSKVAAKAAAKIAAKYAAKGLTAWVPILSAGVCGAVNAWIAKGLMDASHNYYDAKNRAQRRIERLFE